ncbi:MAG TPA: neutral zinc metallopeptidase [Gemmatimonadales bacterium]|nr:neutral zinc metallopeptidase [Gemmatimonadales bacterium]
MRLGDGGRSSDLEDRRGEGGGGGFGGGGLGGRHIGLGGLAILLVLSLVFKQNFFALLGNGGGGTGVAPAAPVNDAAEEPEVRFVSRVLDDAQGSWDQILPKSGTPYRHAHLVLFRDQIESACGFAQSATGPFYCPGDEKVYIDLGFYRELKDRFGAPGDFAQAYVIAHELGHHVQKILGTSDKVHAAMERRSDQANELSVRLELQADCYAGVWASSAQSRDKLDPGDIDEGLTAAAAVGDDRLQRMATGHVNPESFTHGTSAQRSSWFRKGFDSGRIDSCNTFDATE